MAVGEDHHVSVEAIDLIDDAVGVRRDLLD